MKSFVTHTTGGDKYVTTYYVRDPQGNALAVYEWKRGEPSDGALPTVESLTDYYPFGRLGRRWNVDVVEKAYESNYSVLGNTPLIATDVNGADSTLFNENGSILCKIANDNGKTSEYFVVRTTQTTEKMYGGINYTDSKVKGWTALISQNEQTKSILSAMSYGTTKSLVGDNPNTLQKDLLKKYENEILWENFVGIPNLTEGQNSLTFAYLQTDLFNIFDNTLQNRTGYSREFGWNITLPDKEIMFGYEISNSGHPQLNEVLELEYLRKNHTHPAGWAQPPSKNDIENSTGDYFHTRYVWGMGSQTLYIITSDGVVGTIPFSIYFNTSVH